MIVCHCRVVNDAQIARAVDAGARTVAEVCRATGAGGGCGSCVFSLKGLLCTRIEQEQDISLEAERAAS